MVRTYQKCIIKLIKSYLFINAMTRVIHNPFILLQPQLPCSQELGEEADYASQHGENPYADSQKNRHHQIYASSVVIKW